VSLQRLTPDDFEYFALETHPHKRFVSSSIDGVIEGNQYVYARRSEAIKDIRDSTILSNSFTDGKIEDIRLEVVNSDLTNIESKISSYMDEVRDLSIADRLQRQRTIHRFVPPYELNFEWSAKNTIENILMPHHRVNYPSANYSFTNYNCINFRTSNDTPSDAVLMYPNVPLDPHPRSQYELSGSFAFDFWIAPKNPQVNSGDTIRPGTLFHLPGAYSINILSGSSVDHNGFVDKFRLSFQLLDDANLPPDTIDLSLDSNNGGITIVSEDNILNRDEWNHVTITWRGYDPVTAYGSGSIFINGELSSQFNIQQQLEAGSYNNPNPPAVLFVGNFYQGTNTGLNSIDRFFGEDTAIREGLFELNSGANFDAPDAYSFTHPLNAEVHELKIYKSYLSQEDAKKLNSGAPNDLHNLCFYLPPFFTEESPEKKFYKGKGGTLVTPFYTEDGQTSTPFAGRMAFGVGGIYINTENYVRDFATGNYGRLWALTGSIQAPPSTVVESANTFLFSQPSNVKRQYFIMPCDNGNIVPNFNLLKPLKNDSRLYNDLGHLDLGNISLKNIVPPEAYRASSSVTTTGSILDDIIGANPEDVGTIPGASLAIAHRTKNNSSNFVVMFDISSLYYGMRIRPKSFVLKDVSLPMTPGQSFTIRDDGRGNLYRADNKGKHPTWASIGNIFYDEGLVILKAPQLYFFGQDYFEMEFDGMQNIHTFTINALAPALHQTESTNPSFVPPEKDDLANNPNKDYVYITTVNVHDDNLNVIARAHMAQPTAKRVNDKFVFKVKMDY